MLSGLVRRLKLTVLSKTGISTTVIGLGAVAALAAVAAVVFLIFAAFIWLAQLYGPLTSALLLTGFFLLLAVLGAIGCVMSQRRAAEQAKRELQTRQQPLFDPRFLAVGLQVGKSIGLRRIVPLVAAGLLAASLAKEWFGEEPKSSQQHPDS